MERTEGLNTVPEYKASLSLEQIQVKYFFLNAIVCVQCAEETICKQDLCCLDDM